MQKRLLFLMMLLLLTTSSLMAQVTTSSINGKVVADGQDVIGATITAVHVPSGTRYNAVTNDKGRYVIQGMRVGGPYTISISYIGYKDDVRNNISLILGEATAINADLKEDAQVLGEVTVTGVAGRGGMGASSNFSQQNIDNAPTIDRNVYDVAKLSPLVNSNKFGGITIAGTNNRYNSFQIDGVVSNDVFGLASSGTNGGQTGANPISMDAVEQIQVVASPFDVRQSGFTGGAINAITKSGTNVFRATAYGYYTDQNMYSKWSQQYGKKQKLTDESTKTLGFTVGGPIIKDKLFFFGSVEYKKDSYPATYYPGAEGYFLSDATAAAILDRYAKVTGLTDAYNPRNIDTQSWSVLGRLDWNINANNKFALRYQMNDSYKDVYTASSKTYYFNNSGYRMKDKTNSFVAELNSHLSASLYNELRAGVSFIRDERAIPYSGPNVYISGAGNYDVKTGSETGSAKYAIYLGTEYSSGVNNLNQDIWTLEDNLSWYRGNHTFTFGTHNEIYNMKNAFIQAANGQYVYNTITDFMNDTARQFVWKYSDEAVTGTKRWATPFKAGQFGFYAQDKWDVSTLFQLTYGIRFDIPVYFNSPSTNPEFNASDYATTYGVNVGRKPSSSVMVSPRAGFRWFLNDSHSSQLRGGLGIFNGRAPFVWVENAWANTGIEMKGVTIYSPNAPSFSKYGADAEKAANSAKGTADKPVVNTIDRHFKFPQVFRTNLAWEQVLPYDFKLTLEGLYSKNLNNVWFENLALKENGKVYAVNSDFENSATTYYSSVRGSYNQIINIKNTNKGYSYSLSAKVEKSFKFGLDLMASYTFGHSYSVNDGTSSVAASNWGYLYCTDPNVQKVEYSMFDIPHRVLAMANYNSPRYGNGRWQTHMSLTYNGYSGQRYSLTMSDKQSASFNGDYRTGNTLLYIPTETELAAMTFVDAKNNEGKVVATAAEGKEAFGKWIASNKYAREHRGQYARRNGTAAPWENHFDLHISQDFYYLKDRGSKVELVLDIVNVANMLNHNWGTYYASSYNENILQVDGTSKDAKGNQVAKYTYVGNAPTISDFYSRWHAQIGLRVTF